jgi:hypothetical protein
MRRSRGSARTIAGMMSAAVLVMMGASCASGGQEQVSGQPSASQSTAPGLPQGSTVTYAFHDSSVPPPYHRSYVLTFTAEQARIVVDSYGEILADQTRQMTPEAWGQVSATYPEVSGITVTEPEQGCTGGTGFALKVEQEGAVAQDLDGYACGGVNADIEERLLAWVQPVRSLFPPMDDLAPEG